jgi:hypothetical protein
VSTPAPQPIPSRAVDALLLDTTPYLSCEECFERLDAHVEALLAGSSTDPAMDRHLAGCAACADEAESLRQLVEKDESGA